MNLSWLWLSICVTLLDDLGPYFECLYSWKSWISMLTPYSHPIYVSIIKWPTWLFVHNVYFMLDYSYVLIPINSFVYMFPWKCCLLSSLASLAWFNLTLNSLVIFSLVYVIWVFGIGRVETCGILWILSLRIKCIKRIVVWLYILGFA